MNEVEVRSLLAEAVRYPAADQINLDAAVSVGRRHQRLRQAWLGTITGISAAAAITLVAVLVSNTTMRPADPAPMHRSASQSPISVVRAAQLYGTWRVLTVRGNPVSSYRNDAGHILTMRFTPKAGGNSWSVTSQCGPPLRGVYATRPSGLLRLTLPSPTFQSCLFTGRAYPDVLTALRQIRNASVTPDAGKTILVMRDKAGAVEATLSR